MPPVLARRRPLPGRRGRLFPHATDAIRHHSPTRREPLLRLARLALMLLSFLTLALYFGYRYGAASPQLYGPDWDRSGFGGPCG